MILPTLYELYVAARRNWRILTKAGRKLRSRGGVRPTQPSGINKYERRVHSQNGEDGILEELFRCIGTTNKYFVEFGVEDGFECNAAYLARRAGWRGLMLEADDRQFRSLRRNYGEFPEVKTVQAVVSCENVISIFVENGVPREFDLLSIDVDGNDYWIWRNLADYQPRVVIIEYNAAYPPPVRWVMQYNPDHRWDGSTYHGASLTSLAALGSQLGYALLGTESHGANAIFVRQDYLAASGFENRAPESAYHAPPCNPFVSKLPYAYGPYCEI